MQAGLLYICGSYLSDPGQWIRSCLLLALFLQPERVIRPTTVDRERKPGRHLEKTMDVKITMATVRKHRGDSRSNRIF